MMNTKFLWIAALLLAGCSDAADEIFEPNGELSGESDSRVRFVRVGAVAGVDDDSRAVYDADLKLYWESGDRIRAIQGYAGRFDTSAESGELTLESGVNTNRGVFAGELAERGSDAQYFHFLYPSSCGVMTVSSSWGSTSYSTDCSITIPSEQNGRWIPYMWATTPEKTTGTELSNMRVPFNILNGALAVRVYGSDRKTPKRVKSIVVRATGADDHLVGTWSASTAGALAEDSFTFAGGGNEIKGTDLDRIEPLNGLYEYRFAVAPGRVEGLELTLIGEDGTEITRRADAKTFKVNTRSGLNVYWDAATITMDRAASWFEDRSLDGGKLYLNGTIEGAGPDEISEIGVEIDGATYPVALSALGTDGTFSTSIDLPSGNYSPSLYAVVNGQRITCGAAAQPVTVTEIPTLDASVRSSYTNNGAVEPVNTIDGTSIDGSTIYASWSLSDPFFAEGGLIGRAVLKYGDREADILSEQAVSGLGWTTYDNCQVVVELANGVILKSIPCSTTLTGIPYEHDFSNGESDGWTLSNTTWSADKVGTYRKVLELESENDTANNGFVVSPRFHIPSGTNIPVAVSTTAYQYDSYALNYGTWDIWIAPTSDTAVRPSATNPHRKKGTNSMAGSNGGYEMLDTFELTEELPYVGIAHNGVNTWINTRYAVVYGISVKYGTM